MNILEIGSNLLKQHLSTQSDTSSIGSALSQLLGGSNGQLDLAALISQLSANGGVQNLLNSWLGDGQNAPISANQIMDLFGSGKLADFASQLGVSTDDAAGGLASVLPQMLDKASSGGNLLESALGSALGGSGGGLGGMLGGLFKK